MNEIKEIEKKLMNPEKLTLQEIRQIKRELGLLRIEQRKLGKKKQRQLELELIKKEKGKTR